MSAEEKRNAALGRNFAMGRKIALTHFFSIGNDGTGIEQFAFGYRSLLSGSFRTGLVEFCTNSGFGGERIAA